MNASSLLPTPAEQEDVSVKFKQLYVEFILDGTHITSI